MDQQNLSQELRSATLHYGGLEAYSSKFPEYFEGARYDYVAELPKNSSAKIIEIGSGSGGTGALALSQGKCGSYYGVEICESAAASAKGRITQVLLADIEKLELPWSEPIFDALILSEVLEHLADPWSVLRKLRRIMKPDSLVFASTPNISHYRVITMLLRGEWKLTDFGPMDRTHLRWFTPKSFRDLFESCGYHVDLVKEHRTLGAKARLANLLLFGRFRHLFMPQIDLRARCQ